MLLRRLAEDVVTFTLRAMAVVVVGITDGNDPYCAPAVVVATHETFTISGYDVVTPPRGGCSYRASSYREQRLTCAVTHSARPLIEHDTASAPHRHGRRRDYALFARRLCANHVATMRRLRCDGVAAGWQLLYVATTTW